MISDENKDIEIKISSPIRYIDEETDSDDVGNHQSIKLNLNIQKTPRSSRIRREQHIEESDDEKPSSPSLTPKTSRTDQREAVSDIDVDDKVEEKFRTEKLIKRQKHVEDSDSGDNSGFEMVIHEAKDRQKTGRNVELIIKGNKLSIKHLDNRSMISINTSRKKVELKRMKSDEDQDYCLINEEVGKIFKKPEKHEIEKALISAKNRIKEKDTPKLVCKFFKHEKTKPIKSKKGAWTSLSRSFMHFRSKSGLSKEERRGSDERYPKYVLLNDPEEEMSEEQESEQYPKMIMFDKTKNKVKEAGMKLLKNNRITQMANKIQTSKKEDPKCVQNVREKVKLKDIRSKSFPGPFNVALKPKTYPNKALQDLNAEKTEIKLGKNLLKREKCIIRDEKTGIEEERDNIEREREELEIEKGFLNEEKNILKEKKHIISKEKCLLSGRKEKSVSEENVFETERSIIGEEKLCIQIEKLILEEEKHCVEEERNIIEKEKNVLEKEKNILGEEKHVLEEEKHLLVKEKMALEKQMSFLEVDKNKTDTTDDERTGESEANGSEEESSEKESSDYTEIEKQSKTDAKEQNYENEIFQEIEEVLEDTLKLYPDIKYLGKPKYFEGEVPRFKRAPHTDLGREPDVRNVSQAHPPGFGSYQNVNFKPNQYFSQDQIPIPPRPQPCYCGTSSYPFQGQAEPQYPQWYPDFRTPTYRPANRTQSFYEPQRYQYPHYPRQYQPPTYRSDEYDYRTMTSPHRDENICRMCKTTMEDDENRAAKPQPKIFDMPKIPVPNMPKPAQSGSKSSREVVTNHHQTEADDNFNLQDLPFGLLSSFFPRVVIMKTFPNGDESGGSTAENPKIVELPKTDLTADTPRQENKQFLKVPEIVIDELSPHRLNIAPPDVTIKTTSGETSTRESSAATERVSNQSSERDEKQSARPQFKEKKYGESCSSGRKGEVISEKESRNSEMFWEEERDSDESCMGETMSIETVHVEEAENHLNLSTKPKSWKEELKETEESDKREEKLLKEEENHKIHDNFPMGTWKKDIPQKQKTFEKTLPLTKIGYNIYDELVKMSLECENEKQPDDKEPITFVIDMKNKNIRVSMPQKLENDQLHFEISNNSIEVERSKSNSGKEGKKEEKRIVKRSELWHSADETTSKKIVSPVKKERVDNISVNSGDEKTTIVIYDLTNKTDGGKSGKVKETKPTDFSVSVGLEDNVLLSVKSEDDSITTCKRVHICGRPDDILLSVRSEDDNRSCCCRRIAVKPVQTCDIKVGTEDLEIAGGSVVLSGDISKKNLSPRAGKILKNLQDKLESARSVSHEVKEKCKPALSPLTHEQIVLPGWFLVRQLSPRQRYILEQRYRKAEEEKVFKCSKKPSAREYYCDECLATLRLIEDDNLSVRDMVDKFETMTKLGIC